MTSNISNISNTSNLNPFLHPSKSEMRELLITQFAPQESSSKHLSKFFIRYWSKDYFLRVTSLVSLHTGTIPIEGKEFVILYHRCTRGQILQMQAQDQLALSFRAAPDNYALPAYVLVSKPLLKESI